jgi:S1-C subfamily serine protease
MTESDDKISPDAQPAKNGDSGLGAPPASAGSQSAKPANSLAVVLVACLVTGAVCLWLGTQMKSGGPSKHEIADGLGNGPAVVKRGSIEYLAGHALGDNTIAEIVEQTMPCVVSINLEPVLPSESQKSAKAPNTIPFSQYYRRSVGTGLVVRADGYILTSSHVIKPHMHIKVTLNDGRVFDGKLIGKDSFSDLALVKIEAEHLPVAHFGTSKTLKPGEWAVAIGSPLGFDRTVTFGIISAVGRSLPELNNHVELIQTDAAINPGNSGGPLLNTQGEIIAVSSAVRNDAQNISFAVPIDIAREVAAELLESQGNLKRPYLGIHMQDMNPYFAEQLGTKLTEGVLVSNVVPGSPCEKAGIGQYDVITKVNDTEVKTAKAVRELVHDLKPGDVVDITFNRKNSGEERRKVTIGDYPEE